MSFIPAITGLLNEKTAVAILACGLLYVGNSLHQTQESMTIAVESNSALMITESHKAQTEYALNVIEYGIAGTTAESEIFDLIQIWHNDKWGAQVGGITTICESEPNRLQELVSEDLAQKICLFNKKAK